MLSILPLGVFSPNFVPWSYNKLYSTYLPLLINYLLITYIEKYI